MSKLKDENAIDLIDFNRYKIQHLSNKYEHLKEVLNKEKRLYSFFLDLLHFMKFKNPTFYHNSYCYYGDTTRLTRDLRHKTSTGVTNRYFNYLSCLELINKKKQDQNDINNITLVNLSFVLKNPDKMAMNVFSFVKLDDRRLKAINENARLLKEYGVTSGNISNKRLRIVGLIDMGNRVYFNNSYKSLIEDRKDFELIKAIMIEHCKNNGYMTKNDIFNTIEEIDRKRVDKILNLYKLEIKQVFTYKRPTQQFIETYKLKDKKFIYMLK